MASQQNSNMGIIGAFFAMCAAVGRRRGRAVDNAHRHAALTRLYTASEFGLFALFIAASGWSDRSPASIRHGGGGRFLRRTGAQAVLPLSCDERRGGGAPMAALPFSDAIARLCTRAFPLALVFAPLVDDAGRLCGA
jgi:hypothetical protein